jgi:hypothetical protein
MRSPCSIVHAVFLLALLVQPSISYPVHGTDKVSGTVFVKDSLTTPRQEAKIEAKLVSKGLLHDSPLGGEPVELVVNGATAATGMTGGDGRAVLSFVPTAKSIISVQVRAGASPRVLATEGQANVVVWERRTPVLVVEFSSLMEESRFNGAIPGISSGFSPAAAIPDAAEELSKVSQFYYGIMYVTTVPSGADGFAISADARNWLASHKFPPGFVLALSSEEDALGAKIDELHQAGWKSVKTGIGRSKTFVETFLRRRLEAIMVPEPSKGEAPPRKAKVAKDWKDVRKKL